MTLRKLLVPVSFLLLLVPGIAATAREVPGKPRLDAASDLKLGMPAEAVKKALGEPAETRPMKAPNGKAEVWVYVREVSRRAEQIRVATPDIVINITESDGSVRRNVTPGQVTLHDVQYLTEEITEVLLFNDHYVTQKVSRAERKL